jgi:phosphate transport system substrate-binding protein
MKKLVVLIGTLCLMLILGGTTNPAFARERIHFVGCGIVKKAFMAELAKAFTQKYGIDVDIEGGGATLGIRSVASGKADLGGTCRHTIDVPQEQGVKLNHVAWDALVVIVNKSNPVDTITMDQLKAVIEGRIKDWGDLGGPSGTSVDFYARKGKLSGVGLMAREIIFKNANKEFSATQEFDSTGPLEKAIAKNKWAIGVTGISSARKADVKMLKLNGIDTDKANISSGKYLLYRPLYIITTETPSDTAKKFIQFAKSREGQEIISQQGTVNLREGAKLWRLYRQQ